MTKLRLSAHNLPIETGRYKRREKTPDHLRICEDCNTYSVGDEFHLVMKCERYEDIRYEFFEKKNEYFSR